LASPDAKGFLFQNPRKESVTMLPVLIPVIEAVATAVTTVAVQKLLDDSNYR